jgi:hypothetical protein
MTECFIKNMEDIIHWNMYADNQLEFSHIFFAPGYIAMKDDIQTHPS